MVVAPLEPAQAALLMTVFFNGLGSTRQQGLRYANEIATYDEAGKLLYRAVNSPLIEPLIYNVLPAAEFDDVDILHVNSADGLTVHVEERSRRWYHVWADWPNMDDDAGVVTFLPHMAHQRKMAGPGQMEKACGDIRRALDWKRQCMGRRVIVYGWSRGAAIALLSVANLTAGEQREVDLVVAEAPYDTPSNVLADRTGIPGFGWMVSWLPWHYAPLDVTFPACVPVIVGSGTEDRACPMSGQKRLLEKMRYDRHQDATHVVVEGADHCTIHRDSEWRRILHEKYLLMLR